MGERSGIIVAACLCIGVCVASVRAAGPFDELLDGLERIDVAAVTQRAEADAQRLIAGGRFTVRGDRGLAIELSTRPGAFQFYLGDNNGDVVYDVASMSTESPALAAARAWVYQLELFAACVRQGRTPVVRQSPLIDTKHRHQLRYGSDTFHRDRWPAPPPPGSLAQQYLEGLRRTLLDIATASGDALDEARARARDTLAHHGKVYIVTGSTMLAYHLPEPFEPWTGQASTSTSGGGGDLVLAVGDFEEAGYHGHWHDLDAMRSAGRGVVWILNACNTNRRDLLRNEIVLDLWAPFGDGVVKVEHYDARLGPVTGVAQLAVVDAIASGHKADHPQQQDDHDQAAP